MARLKTIDLGALSEQDRINLDVVRDGHERAIEGAGFGYGDWSLAGILGETVTPYAVTQMTGTLFGCRRCLCAFR